MTNLNKPVHSTIHCSNCSIYIDIRQLNNHQCLNTVEQGSKYKPTSIKTHNLSNEFNHIHEDKTSTVSPCSTSSTSSLATPRSSTDYFERFLQKQDVEFFCSQKSVVRINSRNQQKKKDILQTKIDGFIGEISTICATRSLSSIKKKKNQSCSLCAIPVSLETSFEFNGKIYCHRDYQVIKSSTPLQKTCYKCRMTLENGDYKTFKNRMYCKSDFNDMFCKGCSKPIGDDKVVSTNDGKCIGKWHIECFHCQICRQSFPDNLFYVYNSLPYCKRHYHKMNHTLCTRCYNPIEGNCAYIPSQKWRFHPDCFRCEACRNKLEDTYHLIDGRIYCGCSL